MAVRSIPDIPQKNALLAALPPVEYERLLAQCTEVTLSAHTVLGRPHKPLRHVYFPRSTIISVLSSARDDNYVEVAMVGREGMASMVPFLGGDQGIFRLTVQLGGEALCMEASAFREAVARSQAFYEVMSLYVQAFLSQVGQSVACNLLHPAEPRLRRWLLMAHDRVALDQFAITQQVLARMVGLRRPTVSTIASTIQRAGHIQYRRGKITILDRVALEASSCPCYQLVRKEYQRLLGWPSKRGG